MRINKDWLDWHRKNVEVYYRGVNITDRIGICICRNCIQTIRDEIDEDIETGDICGNEGWRDAKKDSPSKTGIYVTYKYPTRWEGEIYSCELYTKKSGWSEADHEIDLWADLPALLYSGK